MTKLETLAAKLAEIDASLDRLLANETLSDDQRAEHDRLVADRAATASALDREEARLERERDRKAREERTAAAAAAAEKKASRRIATGRITDPDPVRRQDVPGERAERRTGEGYTIPSRVRRVGPLKNFRGERDGVPAEVRAYRFGMFMMAKLAIDMPSRFGHFRQAIDWVQKYILEAQNESDSSGAQYLVPPEFGADVIDLRERYGVARRVLRMVQMTSDTRTDPRRRGGLTAYFITQGQAGTESQKIWDNVMLVAKDIMVLSRYTNQINADAVINFGDDLAGEIAYAYSQKEDDCAFNGDGSSTYGGIVGVRTKLSNCDGAGTHSAGLQTAGTTGAWSSIVLADFHATVGLLPQYADDDDTCWTTHRAFYYNVMQRLELAAGGVPAREVQLGGGGQFRQGRPLFLGYPVEFSQIWPSTSAANQVCCALGDFRKGASFGDRQQDEVAFSEHATIGGENVFERNQIAIRGTERIDINVHDAGTASAVGPIVGLTT